MSPGLIAIILPVPCTVAICDGHERSEGRATTGVQSVNSSRTIKTHTAEALHTNSTPAKLIISKDFPPTAFIV